MKTPKFIPKFGEMSPKLLSPKIFSPITLLITSSLSSQEFSSAPTKPGHSHQHLKSSSQTHDDQILNILESYNNKKHSGLSLETV